MNLVIEYDVNGDGTIDFDEFLGKGVLKGQSQRDSLSKSFTGSGVLHQTAFPGPIQCTLE